MARLHPTRVLIFDLDDTLYRYIGILQVKMQPCFVARSDIP